MTKPELKTRTYFDYAESVAWVESLLGYPLIDTIGKFTGTDIIDVEYRDWRHLICEEFDPANGAMIRIGSHLFTGGWEDEITQKFIDEFGEDALYLVEW